ncbi:MAG: twin-arginine translocase TatA/TatE family subunit [Thaumarchaeota archaeon]|nr:twin-arginine translocase TatA/TatE family subunit [Nitrososphaerota archaeon]
MLLQIIGSEIIIIVVVAVILIFGAKKIPEIARSMGRAKGEFKKGQEETDRELEEEKKKGGSAERTKLEEAAKALGIDVAGKSDEQIRGEMRSAIEEKPK